MTVQEIEELNAKIGLALTSGRLNALASDISDQHSWPLSDIWNEGPLDRKKTGQQAP
jgi:hypothetical protein